MIKELMHDPIFLSLKSEKATKEDLQTAEDLLATLTSHKDGCVGMAANMTGYRKRKQTCFSKYTKERKHRHERYDYYIRYYDHYHSRNPVLENGQERDPGARRVAAGADTYRYRYGVFPDNDPLFHGSHEVSGK